MKNFIAENGHTIGSSPGCIYIRNRADELRHTLGGYSVEALREFFQHERDEELGRWRWPENPNVVVYPEADGLHWVVREDTGETRQQNGLYVGTAASDYRDAHQERKPWEDASYKEVWVWTTADKTQEALGWVAGDGTWDIITPKGDGIKAAEDPMKALVEAGFDKFSATVAGAKRVEVSP